MVLNNNEGDLTVPFSNGRLKTNSYHYGSINPHFKDG